MDLKKGDCLEVLKTLPDKSIDFVYLDLPFGQTACKWDIKLDLSALWKELKRLARSDRTPFFFSCTTKFGYELIKSNEKYFRWDLVWEKNRAAGFLNAYKLPMRKHEMIYCFAKKSPEYDVSSHKEFKQDKHISQYVNDDQIYGKVNPPFSKRHKDPLPTSILPPQEDHELIYCFAKKSPEYDVSSHNESKTGGDLIGELDNSKMIEGRKKPTFRTNTKHKDPLPTSILPPQEDHELIYCFAKKSPEYDVSSHNEYVEDSHGKCINTSDLYQKIGCKRVNNKTHKDPLPTSILPPQEDHELVYCFAKKSPEYDVSSHNEYKVHLAPNSVNSDKLYGKQNDVLSKTHKDPLPTSVLPEQPSSWCKFKLDSNTGHRTAKPVALMEFLLKYWTQEGWTVLDPTMGSGSMGIAAKRMKRKFIGIEKDDDIFELAKQRITS